MVNYGEHQPLTWNQTPEYFVVKGHVSPLEAHKTIEGEAGDACLYIWETPVHKWAEWTGEVDEEIGHIFKLVARNVKGSFPVTVAAICGRIQ